MNEHISNNPFSSHTLKILACIFMVIDHVGYALFPELRLLRIIGRIAFPIFAFFIAEGCRYTRNKLKRWATIFLLGFVFETVYFLYTKEFYGNIFLTFSLSILLIYCLQWAKSVSKEKKFIAVIAFLGSFLSLYLVCKKIPVDYGFAGVITPLFVSLLDSEKRKTTTDKDLFFKLVFLSVGLLLITWTSDPNNSQIWSLLALPLIAFYNGKPGNTKYKYGFYVFYPVHLLLIEIIAFFVRTS